MPKTRIMFMLVAIISIACAVSGETLNVDCDAPGQTVSAALKTAKPGDTIRVTGTCQESITITTDDVSLEGQNTAVFDAGGAQKKDVIAIRRAQGVQVKGVRVQSGRHGIHVTAGAEAKLINVTAQKNVADGIRVSQSSRATISKCTSRLNTDDGIEILENAVVKIINCTVQDNKYDGIVITSNSHVTFLRTIASTGNAAQGLVVNHSSTLSSFGANILLRQNGRNGLLNIMSSSSLLYKTKVTVEDNADMGIRLRGNGSLTAYQSTLEVHDNAREGILADTSSSLLAYMSTIRVEQNHDGVVIASSGSMSTDQQTQLTVRRNRNYGIVTHDATSKDFQGDVIFADNASGDLIEREPGKL